MRPRKFLTVLVVIALLGWATQAGRQARAQTPSPTGGSPALFTAAAAPRATVGPNHASRSRYVTVDFRALGLADATGKALTPKSDALAGSAVKLDLFPDASFTGLRERLDQVPATHGLLWTGTLKGVASSNVSLSVIDGTLAGTIFTPQ